MSEIGLQELIYQVKRELLAPNPQERSRDPDPLFVIEKIDLEISVNVSKVKGGEIKLTVLDFATFGGSVSSGTNRGHVVKVSLTSLLSRDALLREIYEDPDKLQMMEKRTRRAFLKSEDLPGFRD